MSVGTRPRNRTQVTFGDIAEVSEDVKKSSQSKQSKHHREEEGEMKRGGGGGGGGGGRDERRSRDERRRDSQHHQSSRHHPSAEIKRHESVRERPRKEAGTSQRSSRHSAEEDRLVSSLKATSISGHHQESGHQDSPAEAADPSTAGPESKPKKKFASKMRSIVSAVKTAQRLERSLHRATDATFVPKYASENIIRSGHLDYNTLFASNEQQTGELTVNLINAPNNSTLQCGCENINCPFCNLMMSIGNTELQ